jgi:hypothetical protein
MNIRYYPPNEPAVLSERRVLVMNAPDPDGRYHITWQAVFTPVDKDVVLDQNWYGGMAARMAADLRPSAEGDHPGWTFLDSEGRRDAAISGQRARWVDFSGPTPAGGHAGVAIFVHSGNPRQPPPWCVILKMPYYNPAFTGTESYTLLAGESLTLRYRILIHPYRMDRHALEKGWRAFVASKPDDTQKRE